MFQISLVDLNVIIYHILISFASHCFWEKWWHWNCTWREL